MEQLTINTFRTCQLWNNCQAIPFSPVNYGTTDNVNLPHLSTMEQLTINTFLTCQRWNN
ncbi:hypothetical protein DPMN_118876 [Dreissena polymorpha]|uniref:Uncharacterized protein n=1 Tax=Dreissena polymorpha TaxID=45954 RepID=A0A9D4GI70_DREPO|nr:hypothetical protein DPMN_118876 [Dreissena polymorpha]